eukprot:jgi/Chlat1/3660/Chrsp238S03644
MRLAAAHVAIALLVTAACLRPTACAYVDPGVWASADQLIKERASNGLIVIAFADAGAKYYLTTLNWVEAMKTIGIDNWALFTFDSAAHRAFAAQGIVSADISGLVPSDGYMQAGNSSNETMNPLLRDFKHKMFMRVVLLQRCVLAGVSALLTDVDAVWRHPAVIDIVTQDVRNIDMSAQRIFPGVSPTFNPGLGGGFTFFNSTPTTAAILGKMLVNMERQMHSTLRSITQYGLASALSQIQWDVPPGQQRKMCSTEPLYGRSTVQVLDAQFVLKQTLTAQLALLPNMLIRDATQVPLKAAQDELLRLNLVTNCTRSATFLDELFSCLVDTHPGDRYLGELKPCSLAAVVHCFGTPMQKINCLAQNQAWFLEDADGLPLLPPRACNNITAHYVWLAAITADLQRGVGLPTPVAAVLAQVTS